MTKIQDTINKQYSNFNIQYSNVFDCLEFGYWNLFGCCFLVFGYSIISARFQLIYLKRGAELQTYN